MIKKTWAVPLTIAVTVGIFVFFVWRGYADFAKIVSHAQPRYLVFTFVASAVTYLFMGLSLWEVLRILGHRLNLGAAVSIAFVSTTINYFISSMGASGFALRAHLLRKRHIPFGASVTASVVITVLLYMILALLVLQGSMFLVLRSQGTKLQIMEGFLGVVVLLAVCFFVGLAFFNHEFRSKWVKAACKGVNHIIYFFSGPVIPQESFIKFEEQLEHGIKIIHRKKYSLAGAIGYVCADWIFNMLILHMAFKTIGIDMAVGPLVAGFALGMVTTLIPVLPGGLGAMELTMTAAYTGFGVEWHSAFVASVIYRIAYYVVPSAISVFVYWGLKLSEPLGLEQEKEAERRIENNIAL